MDLCIIWKFLAGFSLRLLELNVYTKIQGDSEAITALTANRKNHREQSELGKRALQSARQMAVIRRRPLDAWSRNSRRRRGLCTDGFTKHVDVDLLTGLAMTRDTTEEVVVAAIGEGDRVIAGRVGRLGRRRVARPELGMCDVHHVVKLGTVLKKDGITELEGLGGRPLLVVDIADGGPTRRVPDLVHRSIAQLRHRRRHHHHHHQH